MNATPFRTILKVAVENTPNAIGGAFAARDGEIVDFWTHLPEDDWAIITATYGIAINQVRKALHTFHFGDVEFLFVNHEKLAITMQVALEGYFVLLAVTPPCHIAKIERALRDAAHDIRLEMQ